MPRYFFHVMDGCVSIDTDGTELPNIWEVRKEAIRLAAGHLAELDNGLLFGNPWSLTVADEESRTVFALRCEAQTYD